MRLFLTGLIICLLLFMSGCKIPSSVFSGIDTLNMELKKAEDKSAPVIEGVISDIDSLIVLIDDIGAKHGEVLSEDLHKVKEKLIKLKESLTKSQDALGILPKIRRNLDQIRKTLEAFNELMDM